MLCNVCNAHVQNNNKSKSKKGPRYNCLGIHFELAFLLFCMSAVCIVATEIKYNYTLILYTK